MLVGANDIDVRRVHSVGVQNGFPVAPHDFPAFGLAGRDPEIFHQKLVVLQVRVVAGKNLGTWE